MASLDALGELWLERLADRAIVACRIDVHAASGVHLDLSLPEGWLRLASPAEPAHGGRGFVEALHACFVTAEQILRDRRELLERTSRRPRTFASTRTAVARAA
jgi:hypothetical protein